MYLCCLRQLFGGSVEAAAPLHPLPSIVLDTASMGHEAVVVKQGLRLCGSGAALGNTPILQDKAYFEVKLQQAGQERDPLGHAAAQIARHSRASQLLAAGNVWAAAIG